jgi:hypothetical protein
MQSKGNYQFDQLCIAINGGLSCELLSNGIVIGREADVLHQLQRYLPLYPERIFNIKKVPYKQYNNEKCKLPFSQDPKFKISPFQEEPQEPKTRNSTLIQYRPRRKKPLA